ncbi:hypothetical protein KKG24_04250 [Patescibacteria group bacterium]|nr:hypothetical protein [Patescibacteria group bacterium]
MRSIDIYKEVQNKILLYGQMAFSEIQFKAFRKLVLDEFAKAERGLRAGLRAGTIKKVNLLQEGGRKEESEN